MSELINARLSRNDFRWYLLASVSVAALAASVYAPDAAFAEEDTDRPTLWIELGGQFEQTRDEQAAFAPPFVANLPSSFFSPLIAQKAPLQYSIGSEGAISFEPEGSDWVFSASLRFGRANGVAERHQQTPNARIPVHFSVILPPPLTGFNKYKNYTAYPDGHVKLEDVTAQRKETHSIVDFQVGKDVGLGLFGRHGSSVLSAGVRFAQFTSKTNISLRAQPDVHYPAAPITSKYEDKAFTQYHVHFHGYSAALNAQRSFHGLGPSIAWSGSAPFVGELGHGEVAFDWDANAAILFGRQKVHEHHQSNARSYYGHQWNPESGVPKSGLHPGTFFPPSGGGRISTLYAHTANFNRTRTVAVPNLGGMAGISFLYSNAKVSFGYRADFFFGAMDGGIDTARKENQGFYGPFASISVGLGG